jgi:Raf kinase inhibitor-like YbhB/YbcL family protein
MRRAARRSLAAVLVALATGGTSMAFELTSTAFDGGKPIPKKHTCEGANLSPPLRWKDPPAGTKSFALVADDPDAPAGTWTHWVLYDLPASVSELAEGVPADAKLANGGKQGLNDFRKTGYGGPCPPPGKPHRYFFRLDAPIALAPNATKDAVLQATKGHVLGHAELMGTYQR